MKTRLIALFLLAALLISFCAACGSDTTVLTDEQAQQIALEDAGLADAGVTGLHTHFNIVDNVPQFQIHFSYGGQEYEYVIHGQTGEILSGGK